MTENLSLVEITAFVMAVVIAAAAVVRHMPRWAVYVITAGVALYSLLAMLRDGPSIENVGRTAIFSVVSAMIWWRDLRGARRSSCDTR